MRIGGEISVETLKHHEASTKSNLCLGGYDMDKHCPLSEFKVVRAHFENGDEKRIYLLGQFAKHTRRGTCKLTDVSRELLNDELRDRNKRSFDEARDLRTTEGFEPVLVTDSLDSNLVAIDGNNRLIAQWILHGDITEMPAFVCVHPNIWKWPFVPASLKK